MILNQINYKMPIYKDCTLGEILFVGLVTFLTLSTGLSLLTKILFGYGIIGFSISVLSMVHITRFLLGRLQKLKYGKPYGYYHQLLFKKLQTHYLFQSILKLPYIQRQGKWSVRRYICR